MSDIGLRVKTVSDSSGSKLYEPGHPMGIGRIRCKEQVAEKYRDG